MRNGVEDNEKSLRSLAQHVKDLRKMWYLEHENNRRLVNLMQSNSGTRSKSGRRSAVPGDSRDLINLSSLATDLSCLKVSRDCEQAFACYSCLSAVARSALRSAFAQLCRDPRPLYLRVCTALRIRRVLSLKNAVRLWRTNSTLAGIVLRVNADLRFIRAFDRLDVMEKCCAIQNKKTALQALKRTKTVKRNTCAAIIRSVTNICSRRGFHCLYRHYIMYKGITKMGRSVMRHAIRIALWKLRGNARIAVKFQHLSALYRKLVDRQVALSFGFLCGLLKHKRWLRSASTSLTSSARSLYESPDRRAKLGLLTSCAATGLFLTLKAAVKRTTRTALFLCRKRSEPSNPLWNFAMLLARKRTKVYAGGFNSILLASKWSRVAASCSRLAASLTSYRHRISSELLPIIWNRLTAHYEKNMEKSQGVEAFASALATVKRRIRTIAAWKLLQRNTRISRLRASLCIGVLSALAKKHTGTAFQSIVADMRWEIQRGEVYCVANLVAIMKQKVRYHQQALFTIYRNSLRSSLVAGFTQWKIARINRIGKVRHSLTALAYTFRQFVKLKLKSVFSKWRKPEGKLVAAGYHLLHRAQKRREKLAFSLLRQHKDLVVSQSNAICFAFSLNSVLPSMKFAVYLSAFEELKRFSGFVMDKKKAAKAVLLLTAVSAKRSRTLQHAFRLLAKSHLRDVKGRLTALCAILGQKAVATKSVALHELRRPKLQFSLSALKLAAVVIRNFQKRQLHSLVLLKQHRRTCKSPKTRLIACTLSSQLRKSLGSAFLKIRVYTATRQSLFRPSHTTPVDTSPYLPHRIAPLSQSVRLPRESGPLRLELRPEGLSRSPHRPPRMLTTNLL